MKNLVFFNFLLKSQKNSVKMCVSNIVIETIFYTKQEAYKWKKYILAKQKTYIALRMEM